MKERAKEKEKEKKAQQKKKKVNDLERAAQKSGAAAYANKQVLTEYVCLTNQKPRQAQASYLQKLSCCVAEKRPAEEEPTARWSGTTTTNQE